MIPKIKVCRYREDNSLDMQAIRDLAHLLLTPGMPSVTSRSFAFAQDAA